MDKKQQPTGQKKPYVKPKIRKRTRLADVAEGKFGVTP